MATLKNINFMSESRFTGLGSLSEDELYAVAVDVVTTAAISKTTNGYIKFGNGIIINWFSVNSNQSSGTKFTFAYPFSSATSYGVALCGSNSYQYYTANNKTATGIDINSNGGGHRSFIAIGY